MMNRDKQAGRTLRSVVRTGALAAVAILALAGGCSKKPPPKVAPPAPPPAPPPPASIKLEDVAQEVHADARVSVAPGLEMSESDADLAKAMVRLADAIAKGDASTVRPMLTRNAQTILDTLDAEGGWSAGTSKIEAVRIVYTGGVPSSAAASAAGAAPTDDPQAMMQQMRQMAENMAKSMQEALSKLSPAGQKFIQEQITKGMADMQSGKKPPTTPDAIEAEKTRVMDAAKAANLPAEDVQTLTELMNAQTAAAAAAAGAAEQPKPSAAISSQGFLIAVQDPNGSYLLGWQAANTGGGWAFANTPTNMGVRPRASAWDGIGEAGFSDGPAAAPAAEPGKTDAAAADPSSTPSSPDAPPAEPSSPGPTKKSTPAGPITIPGG